jgi:glycosyltransferase involved in cell wall biosynthesis
LAQDYPSFEVIVVDDNGEGSESQTRTFDIIRPFIDCPNFKYITHKYNINGSAARNTGIKNAKGSYIAFLDDDDILHKDSIRKRYECLSKRGEEYGIVFSSFSQYIDGEKDYDCIYSFDGSIIFDYLSEKIHSPSSVLMIRRNILDSIGLWDEQFRRHQDWEFVTRIVSKYKACSIPDITVDRIVTWRNNAKNPELFEEQRLFFLNKMKPIILSLEKKQIKQVYFFHYTDVGKNYLKYKKFSKAFKFAVKSGFFFKALSVYVKSTLVYLKKTRY